MKGTGTREGSKVGREFYKVGYVFSFGMSYFGPDAKCLNMANVKQMQRILEREL